MERKKILENKIKIITAFECELIFGKPDSCKISQKKEYDKQGHLIEAVAYPNERYSFKNFYKYNSSGQILEQGQIRQNDTINMVKSEFDTKGNKIKAIGYQNGKPASWSENVYDKNNKLILSTLSLNDSQKSWTVNKYDGRGLLTETSSFNGEDTILEKYFYNSNNKIKESTWQKLHSNETSTTVNVYANDTLISETVRRIDGSWRLALYKYDNMKRLIQSTHSTGDSLFHQKTGDDYYQTIDYFYDDKGNLSEELTVYDNRGHANILKKSYTYDTLGNLTFISFSSNPEGATVSAYTYDNKNRLIGKWEIISGDTTFYQYTYDERTENKVREVIRRYKRVSIKEFDYNERNKLIKLWDYFLHVSDSTKLLRNTIDYKYNTTGNIAQADYTNYFMELMYKQYIKKHPQDSLKKHQELTPRIYSVVYKYDSKGNLIDEYEEKNLTESSGNNVSSYKYFYNDKGKLIEKQNYSTSDGRVSYKILYQYDSKGRLTIQKHTRDDKSENISSIVYYFYNSANKLLEEYKYNERGTETAHRKYFYDASGNLIEEKNFSDQRTITKYIYEKY